MSTGTNPSTGGAATSPDFKPTKPTMGELVKVGPKEWCAWTGGIPTHDWTGLKSTPTEPETNQQMRPINPASALKGDAAREKGLTPKFGKSSSVPNFIHEVNLHLVRHGMDTISYIEDPDNTTNVVCVVSEYSRLDPVDACQKAATLKATNYDHYDRQNSVSAVRFLLNCLEKELRDDLILRVTVDKHTFVEHWFELMRLATSVSYERFESLKNKLKSIKITKFPQQNVTMMVNEYIIIAKELTDNDMYDHALTLHMAKMFLEGGGSANTNDPNTLEFRMALVQLKNDLDKAMLAIKMKMKADAEKYINKHQLDYRSVLQQVESVYRNQLDNGCWGPAILTRDNHAAPKLGAHVVQPALCSSFGSER